MSRGHRCAEARATPAEINWAVWGVPPLAGINRIELPIAVKPCVIVGIPRGWPREGKIEPHKTCGAGGGKCAMCSSLINTRSVHTESTLNKRRPLSKESVWKGKAVSHGVALGLQKCNRSIALRLRRGLQNVTAGCTRVANPIGEVFGIISPNSPECHGNAVNCGVSQGPGVRQTVAERTNTRPYSA